MPHVILLGDSVFDNGPYTGGAPDVPSRLAETLPNEWHVTNAAVDGARIAEVAHQLAGVDLDASAAGEPTHLLVSVGGNDALAVSEVLAAEVFTVGEALQRMRKVVRVFREDYRRMLQHLAMRGLPTALCTIYEPRFADRLTQQMAVAGLAHFNDAIQREAHARGLPLLDLRLICTTDEDFVLEIEPSAVGGTRIAAAAAVLLREHDFRSGRCTVYGGTPEIADAFFAAAGRESTTGPETGIDATDR
jgi:lysophospholipase L1-like esterase